jgi:hypothetical protein
VWDLEEMRRNEKTKDGMEVFQEKTAFLHVLPAVKQE